MIKQTKERKMIMFKTVDEIKKAVDNGENVFWNNFDYVVRKSLGGYSIYHVGANHCEGNLTLDDGVTLNGEIWDFFSNKDYSIDGSIEQCLEEVNQERIKMMYDEIWMLRKHIGKYPLTYKGEK